MAQNTKHQFALKIIAIFIPFLFLCLVELFLRVINYGYDTRLFIEDNAHKGTFKTNTQISKLFFSNQKNARVGIPQAFNKQKKPETFRIFVLGESSAYGFPFTPRVSFGRLLEDRLSNTFVDKKIEVINLSVTAINSFAFLTFAKEIIKMNPDAVLIYGGHNEYYGAMGVGCSQGVGSNRNVINSIIFLKRFKIIQLIFDFSESVKAWSGKLGKKENKSFMFRMAGEQEIAYGSDIYFKGIDQFRNNMKELLTIFDKQNIPVFLSTLVCNEKDQKPFKSILKQTSDSAKFLKNFRKEKQTFSENNTEVFLNCFITSNLIDSGYAMNHFLMGEKCYKSENYTKAERYFSNSKELDALRFRAPEAINNEIRNLCKMNPNIHLVDAYHEFKGKSQNGILDNNLFMDHLHPNIFGNFLLSDAFYTVILKTNIPGKNKNIVSFENAWKELPVTDVDSIYGMYTTIALKQQWPFYEELNFKPDTTNYPENLTVMMFRNEIDLNMAMDSLYHYYTVKNNVPKALKVVKSLALAYPHDWRYAAEIGNCYAILLNFDQSTHYYKKAFKEYPNVDIARKIVFNLLHLDKPEETNSYLNFIIQNQPDDGMAKFLLKQTEDVIAFKKLQPANPEYSHALFGLANYYITIKDLEKAKLYIDQVYAKYSKDKEAVKLLKDYNELISENRISK